MGGLLEHGGAEVLRELHIEFFELLYGEANVAQWTVLFLLRPLFDALRVEIVSPVARQWCYSVALSEIVQANYTFSVLLEAKIDRAGHLFEGIAHRAMLLRWQRL